MKKLLAIATFTLLAAMPSLQAVYAQSSSGTPMSHEEGRRLNAVGLALEHRGDDKGAFVAFLDAAEGGYPPAQRRLGEIYEIGNSAVQRNYEESIRWYQKAREGGEDIPPQPSHGTMTMPPVRVGP
jgi:TPR repeat protein